MAGGRPPKEKSFANMLRIAITEAHEDGKPKLRAVAEALVIKGLAGDIQAIREIADRLDGKPAQAVEHSGKMTVSHEDALRELE